MLYPVVAPIYNRVKQYLADNPMGVRTFVDQNPELFINTQVPAGMDFSKMFPVDQIPPKSPVPLTDVPGDLVPVVPVPDQDPVLVPVMPQVDYRKAALYGLGLGALGGAGVGLITGGDLASTLTGGVVGAGIGGVAMPLLSPYLLDKITTYNT